MLFRMAANVVRGGAWQFVYVTDKPAFSTPDHICNQFERAKQATYLEPRPLQVISLSSAFASINSHFTNPLDQELALF